MKMDVEAHVAHDDEPTLMFACRLVEEESKPLTSLLPIRPLSALLSSIGDSDLLPPPQIKLVEAKVSPHSELRVTRTSSNGSWTPGL